MKHKARKKYTPFEKVLGLLPKLSVAESLLVHDVLLKPTKDHIQYIKRELKAGHMRSHYRTVYPDLPVRIIEEPKEYGRWVKGKWRPYSKKTIKKYTIPMTISDKPTPL